MSGPHPPVPAAAIGDQGKAPWAEPPTSRARAGLQRAVARLLDALAPERPLTRAARPKGPIERHRTPRGCILQGVAAAVSVSWFPDADGDSALGSLEVTVWHGVVSRPGATHRAPGGARVVRTMTFCPVGRTEADRVEPEPVETEPGAVVPATEWLWCAADGAAQDGDALARFCLALLDS